MQAGFGLDMPGQNPSLKFISPIPSHCLSTAMRPYKIVFMNLVPCLLAALSGDQQNQCGVSESLGLVDEGAGVSCALGQVTNCVRTTRPPRTVGPCKQKYILIMTLGSMKAPMILRKPE